MRCISCVFYRFFGLSVAFALGSLAFASSVEEGPFMAPETTAHVSSPAAAAHSMVSASMDAPMPRVQQPSYMLRRPAVYLKTRALAQVVGRLMDYARTIYPGQTVEVIPQMFLGAWGYPLFLDIDRSSNAGILLFDVREVPAFMEQGTHYLPVFLVKPAELGNGLLKRVKDMGLAVEEYREWAFVADKPEYLNALADKDALLDLVQERARSDIEFCLRDPSRQSKGWHANVFWDLFRPADEKDVLMAKGLAAVANLVGTTLEHMQELALLMDLEAEVLRLNLKAPARPGTPEHSLFSARAGGSVKLGMYLPNSLLACTIARFNRDALHHYTDYALQTLDAAGDADLSAFVQAYRSSMDIAYPVWDGTIASATIRAASDEGPEESFTLMGGTMQDDRLTEMLSVLYEGAIPELIEAFVPRARSYFGVEKEVYRIEGVPVHKAFLRSDALSGGLEVYEYVAALRGTTIQVHNNDRVAVDLIRRMRKNQPATFRAFDDLTLDEYTLLRSKLYVHRIIADLYESILQRELIVHPENPMFMDELLEGLRSAPAAPAELSVQVEGGAIDCSLKIERETFARVAEEIVSINAQVEFLNNAAEDELAMNSD